MTALGSRLGNRLARVRHRLLRSTLLAAALSALSCTPRPTPPSLSDELWKAAQKAPAAAPAAAVPAGRSRPAAVDEMLLVRHLMRDASRLRGLPFKTPVEVRIQDRAAMRGYVHDAIEPEKLARVTRRYVALGVLPPELDTRAVLEALMEEELIGYYDPQENLLALRDDVVASGALRPSAPDSREARATVVHELVHALQDQHFDLSSSLDTERATDAENALSALIEGDATLCMLAHAAESAGVDLASLAGDRTRLEQALNQELAADSLLANAPPIVREPLLFRYREGALYAAALVAQGGLRALDAAHLQPPSTTHEVLNLAPTRQQPHSEAAAEMLARVLSTVRVERLDEDTLGRLELGVVLGQQGREVAARWRGDRYAVLGEPDAPGAAWVIEVSDPPSAQRVAQLLTKRCQGDAVPCWAAHSREFALFVRRLGGADADALRQSFAR